jgi:S1-C subfamily serine protease
MLKWISAALLSLAAIYLPLSAAELSARDILAKSKKAVVQIFINGEFHGTGFIVSKDGLIVTANHVVTTQESKYTEFFTKIEVKIPNDPHLHFARPALPMADSFRIHDTAILRIEVIDLPYLILGDWNESQQADTVTLIAFVPTIAESLIVTGIVSAKSEETIAVRPKAYQLRKIIFQVPVRGGVSGSPVFSNATGHVIGIETSKVFGITQQLDNARESIRTSGFEISMGKVDLGDTIASLIDTLKENLISGLGSAVDISYAKEMLEEAKKDTPKQ